MIPNRTLCCKLSKGIGGTLAQTGTRSPGDSDRNMLKVFLSTTVSCLADTASNASISFMGWFDRQGPGSAARINAEKSASKSGITHGGIDEMMVRRDDYRSKPETGLSGSTWVRCPGIPGNRDGQFPFLFDPALRAPRSARITGYECLG